MWFLYIFALVPILVGIFLWFKDKQITLHEWLIGSGVSLFVAFIFNLIAIGVVHSKTSDVETWSGYVTSVEHHPEWVERWEEAHYVTHHVGKTSYTTVYYTTEYDTHVEHWEAKRYFGEYNDSINISEELYNEIKKLFGGKIIDGGKQNYDHGGSFRSGDRNIYTTCDDIKFVYPATITRSFENRIKATPNLFAFSTVPTNLNISAWPENPTWNKSDRLIGTAQNLISLLKFDQLNAQLGSTKYVNLIFVGVGDKDSMYGQYYESKFFGGKKNDLVVVFGGGTTNKAATWAYCFGWTESDIVKRNLETLFLSNPINNSILSKVQDEIKQNYVIKDWHKFDYIKISPPMWVFVVYIILTIIIQVILYIVFHNNDDEKDDNDNGMRRFKPSYGYPTFRY